MDDPYEGTPMAEMIPGDSKAVPIAGQRAILKALAAQRAASGPMMAASGPLPAGTAQLTPMGSKSPQQRMAEQQQLIQMLRATGRL